MRALAALLILSLCSCGLLGPTAGVSTKVYEAGQLVLSTGADIQSVSFRTPGGTSLVGAGVNHSSPILANGSSTAVVLDALGRVGGVIGGGIVGGILAGTHATSAAVTAVVPAVTSHAQGMVNPPTKMQLHNP
jgi:hypothetical protein